MNKRLGNTYMHTHTPIQMETKLYERKTNKTKNTNHSNLRQKIYKNPIEFILGCIPTAGYGTCPEVQLIDAVRLHWRKINFQLQAEFKDRQLLGQGWEFMFTSPSQQLDRLCLGPVLALCLLPQLCELHVTLSYLEGTVCFKSPILSSSYSLSAFASTQFPKP